MEVLKQRYANRPSGFTRIVPVGTRHGDGALMSDVILIDAAEPVVNEEPVAKVKKVKKASAPKKVTA